MIFLKKNSKNMFSIVIFYLLIFGCSPGPNEGPVPPVEEGQVSTSNIIIGEKEYSYSTRVHDISKEGEEPVLIYLPLKNGDTIENEILELIDSSGIDAITLKDYADNYNISVREFTDIIQATETARKKRYSGYDGTKETFEEVIALFDLLLEYFGDNGVIDLIDTIAVLDLTIEEFNELCKSALGENWPESVSEKFKSWDNMYKNFYISNYSTIDKFLESSISESSHNRQVLAAFLTILEIAKTAAEVFDVAEAFVSEALQLFSPNPKNVPLPNMTTSIIFGEDGKDLKKYAGTRRYNFLTYWYPLALAKRQVIPITLRNEHDGIHDLTIEMESYYGGKRNRPPYTGDDKEKKAKEEAAKDVTWIPLIRVSKTVNQMDQNNCLWRVHNYIPSATIKYSKTWNLKNTNLSTGKDKYFKDAHITIRVLTKRIAFCHIKNHYIHVILRFCNDEPYKTLSWHAKQAYGEDWAQGTKYDGGFKDDKCHGNGTFIYPDGSRYEREHKDDNYDGQGTLTLSTGNKYEGEWKDNIKVGAFIITSSDGTRKTGEYIEGKLQGEPQVIEKIEETGTYDGWVYISINPSLQKNYLKIGYTRRTPEVRARELSEDTGTPTEFLVAYKRQVYDCEKVESLVHKALHRYRITGQRNDRQREFFVIPLQKAIETMNIIVDEENKYKD